jgi:hypothetical protein
MVGMFIALLGGAIWSVRSCYEETSSRKSPMIKLPEAFVLAKQINLSLTSKRIQQATVN